MRPKNAECFTTNHRHPHTQPCKLPVLDGRRLWPPDPGPQHWPKLAGASRALESLYHAVAHDRNAAQINLYNPTRTTPELRLALHKCTRQKVGSVHLLLPIPLQQAIIASHKLIRTEQPKYCMPGHTLGSSSACPVGYKQLNVAAPRKSPSGDHLASGLGLSDLSAGFIVVQPELWLTTRCGQQLKTISSFGLRNCETVQPAKLTDSPWDWSRSVKRFDKDQRWCRLTSLGQTLHFLIGKRNKMKS